ncbi:carbohydrate ABC transporter permease [Rugosimonospora africana]|uniref:carbohydrate ABC transporter permease n=1 Tax=Rugosimonospora africana TaxID=556532 RepID=UPI00194527EE|nr:carbohydrate ABC transporter permease [Rugosimonospora africana]
MTSRGERIWTYVLLAVITLAVVFPLIWVIGDALSPDPNGSLDLGHLTWSNFGQAWREGGFSQYLTSSVIITGSVVVIGAILAVMSGYAFGVLGVFGERLLFPLVLLGITLPMETFVVPLYYDFQSYGITDTYRGIVLAHIGMSVSFGTFWMRTAFRAVPRAIAESAEIDGAGTWTRLWRVYLPLARPAIVTLILLSFTWTWNDYFLSLILVSDPAHQPLTLGLGAFSGRYLVHINLLSAAAVLISLPVVVLCLVFQRQFIRGILSGALKE